MTFADHLAEFRKTLKGDYIAAVEAQRFVKKLKRENPDALAKWVEAKTVDYVRETLQKQNQMERSKALRDASKISFAKAAESGDLASLSIFAVHFPVDEENTMRSLEDMRGPDYDFPAERYENEENVARMMGAFLRALQKKVGEKRTGDVMTVAPVERLLRSIGGDLGDLGLAA